MQRTLRGNEQGAYRSGPPGRNGRNDWECRYTAAGPLQGTRSGNHRYIVTGAKDPILYAVPALRAVTDATIATGPSGPPL